MTVEDEFSEFLKNPTRDRLVCRALSYACRLDCSPATPTGVTDE